MNTESEKTKRRWFFGGLVFVAWVINFQFLSHEYSHTHPQMVYQPPQAMQPQPSVQPQPQQSESQSVAARQAAEEAANVQKAAEAAAAEHVKYLARYLNPDFSRKSGTMLAVAAVSEEGRYNRTLSAAIGSRLKTGNVEITSSFFTPEFVSDGLFATCFTDSNPLFNKLELAKSLDALVLARQQVEYSSNPSLGNVISAHMQLELMISSVSAQEQFQTWTLKADGAGFNQKAARLAAEERLIKQIANDPKMTLSGIIPNN